MHDAAFNGSSKIDHRSEAAKCSHFAIYVAFTLLNGTDLKVDECKKEAR